MDGATLQVENSTIFGFAGDPLLFQPSGASQLFVSNTSIRNSGGSVWVQPGASGTATASFNNVRVENNQRGIAVYDGSTVVIRNSFATGNVLGNGLSVFSLGTPSPRAATLTVENSTSSRNGGNGLVSNGSLATLRLSNVTATDNGIYTGTGAALFVTGGGSVYSFGGNRFAGNAGGDVSGVSLPLPQIPQQ